MRTQTGPTLLDEIGSGVCSRRRSLLGPALARWTADQREAVLREGSLCVSSGVCLFWTGVGVATR